MLYHVTFDVSEKTVKILLSFFQLSRKNINNYSVINKLLLNNLLNTNGHVMHQQF